jgi:hypothetical protein
VVDDQGFDDKILVAHHVQYLCTAIVSVQQIIKMVVKKVGRPRRFRSYQNTRGGCLPTATQLELDNTSVYFGCHRAVNYKKIHTY